MPPIAPPIVPVPEDQPTPVPPAPPAAPTPPPAPQEPAVTTWRPGKASNDMLEPGESLVTIVRRHPIGIFGFYIEAFIGLVMIIGFGWFLLHSFNVSSIGLVVSSSLLAVTVLLFFIFVAAYVYRQCRILVTDRSLIQITQRSLFSRKVSRLSLSNVEDVSANTQGILASMFGYGTLFIQTAGTLDNFQFPYCPNPTFYADKIIEARQRYAGSLQEAYETHPSDHAIRGLS